MTSACSPTLVVHTGGIGDFLLACPAIACLGERGVIELAGRQERLALAVEAGLADVAHDLERIGFESVFAGPSDAFRAFLGRYDRAVVWMQDDGTIADAFRSCGVSDVQAFPGLPPDDWRGHASAYYLSCIGERIGSPLRLTIRGSSDALDVVIHPGSGGARKNWPMDRFSALAGRLESAGRRVAWCRGPAEEMLEYPPSASILQADSLTGLAGRLAAARCYIGNDSGITHLAVAVGCPTVAIFGPTDARVWAPLGAHVRVMAEGAWPGVDAVVEALNGSHRLG